MEAFKNALSEATQRVISGVGGVLPGLLVLFLAVLSFAVVGWLLGLILARVLRVLRLDERVHDKGFETLVDWSPKSSPTVLIRRIVTWSFIFVGWLVGVAAFGAGESSPVAQSALAYIPRIVTALVVVAVGNMLARFLARGVLISAVNMQIQSARMLSAAVRWLVLVFVLAMVLEHLGIGPQVVRLAFAILFGGIVLTAALAVGLGSRDQVSRSWENRSRDRSEERQEHLRHV